MVEVDRSVDGTFPLQGQVVLVTRAAGQSGDFSDRLQTQGATVIEMPALEIGPPSSWEAFDEAIAQLDTFDWLILTSANGVNAFFNRLSNLSLDQSGADQSGADQSGAGQSGSEQRKRLRRIKIAVVGKKTAHSLNQRGYEPDFTPPNFVADSLVEHFPEAENLANLRLLFPRVESGGRAILVKELTARGATVVEVPAYQSQCPRTIEPKALEALQAGSVDIVTFASSKTVRFFKQLLTQALTEDLIEQPSLEKMQQDSLQEGAARCQTILQDTCIASIGPQTSKTCQQLLGRVDVEAEEYTLDGLVGALIRLYCP